MCHIDCHCHHESSADDAIAVRNIAAAILPPSGRGPFTAGIHPWDTAVGKDYRTALRLLEEAAANARIIAVGECGLDRLRGAPLPEQQTVLRWQLELAARHGLPVIIHCVRCWPELLAVKRDFPEQCWLIHGFRGNAKLLETLLDVGCFISFGPALLRSENLRFILATAPENRIMLETDDTDSDIKDIFSAATVARRAFPADLKRQLQLNFTVFFGKDSHEYQ